MSGRLFIVSTPIGNMGDMTERAVETLKSVEVIAAEDTRQTAKLLNRFGIKTRLMSCHKFSEEARKDQILAILAEGKDVAVVTDAGTPVISDPGDVLVRSAVESGYTAVPVPGACAAVAALTVSAINAGEFAFFGFLPKEKNDRRTKLLRAGMCGMTAVLYESPHQLKNTLALIDGLWPNRRIAVAKELTKIHETVFRGTASQVAGLLGDGEVRGEYVIIMEAALEKAAEASDDEILTSLKKMTAAGSTGKKAVADTAVLLGVNKNRVYKLLLGMKD